MSERKSAASGDRSVNDHSKDRRELAEVLSIRIDQENPDHHLWNNNGTWWCHYTVHTAGWQKKRVRVSLGTRCVEQARERRDRLIEQLGRRTEAGA